MIPDPTPKPAKITAPPIHTAVAPVGPASVSPQQFAAQQVAKSSASQQQYQDYLNTNMGRIDGTAITAQANSELAGMLAPTLAGFQQQQQQGTAAIGQYTKEFAGALGTIGPQINQAYSQAQGQQGTLDTAIAAELARNGGAQASNLGASLAQAGQNTSPAAQAAQAATGAAGASFATGSADLSSLIQQGAASKAFGATLPGIAALAGYQALGSLNTGISNDESKAVAAAVSKYPTLVNQLTGSALKAQSNQTSQAYDAARVGQEATANQIRQEGVGLTASKDQAAIQEGLARIQQGNARLKISQQQANTSAVRANNSASQEQFTQALDKAKLSDAERKQAQSFRIQQQRIGIESTDAAIRAAQTTQKLKSGGFTPAEVQRFSGNALTIAQNARQGVPAVGTKAALPAISYQQAILEMEQSGIPYKIALNAANRFYPQGDAGRPASKALIARNDAAIAKAKAGIFGG